MPGPVAFHHRSLADLYETLGIPLEKNQPLTIHPIEELHKKPITSPLFRADYYSFLFIKTGKGSYRVDELTFETGPGTVYFTNPGHLKAFSTEIPYTGYIVTFEESFLQRHLHKGILAEFPFLLAETVPPGHLSETEFSRFSALLSLMHKTVQSEDENRFYEAAHLFAAVLHVLKSRFWGTFNPQDESDRPNSIVYTFKKNLEKVYQDLSSYRHLPGVAEFAALQHLHPGYFTTVIREKTGRPVNRWITEKTLSEAREMLLHGGLPIKEIAYHFKFSEPTHFVKFFKKNEGVTPAEFRKIRKS